MAVLEPGRVAVNGRILWGANNIFSVQLEDGSIVEGVRIKGKQLDAAEGEHNALAPGDRVRLDSAKGSALIAARQDRVNSVRRWNRSRHRPQAMAANVDEMWLVASAGTPQYRPDFMDRALAMAELESLEAVIVVNKADLALSAEGHEHLEILRQLGYPCILSSAVGAVDRGRAELRSRLEGRSVALVGQSGVGKSSLINTLVPAARQTTGDVSRRYRRGKHTTTLARQVLVDPRGASTVIDTPGIREFDLFGYRPDVIAGGFREIARRSEGCRLSDCSHTHEPVCAVRRAVEEGVISTLRYRSYLRIMEELQRMTV